MEVGWRKYHTRFGVSPWCLLRFQIGSTTKRRCHNGSLFPTAALLQCTRDRNRSCTTFELVSPILRGESGFAEVRSVLAALERAPDLDVSINKSMGFHVHVGVDDLNLDDLKRICHNFVKYEQGMDNRGDMGYKHEFWIYSSRSKYELYLNMQPLGRHYKLNLLNLVIGRQPTIEFRQHSGTADASKVLNWVRFCLAFVENSAGKQRTQRVWWIGSFHKFRRLFKDLILDEELQAFYEDRLDYLASS